MEHDAWFFIGVFVFIFLIWISTGGPLHPISFTGPSLAQPQELGGGTYLQFPRAPFSIGNKTYTLQGSYTYGSNSGSPLPIPTFIGGGLFGTPSPYRNLVSLSHYVSGAGSQDPINESLQLSVGQNAGVPVDISEWRLLSDATGNSIAIPKGTEIPTSGVVNAVQDIILTPGTRAIIISGQSPIGASFRENKCIGYFGNFQTFYPSLPLNCPTPSDELASHYGPNYIRDPFCIDEVYKISRCQVMLTPPAGATSACQNFMIKYLNYNGCVEAHKNDSDFLGDTWRIYLGRSNSMWRTKNELVKLLDVNGKTVDAFTY